jgi:curved DNA-binding protein CbpA
VATTPDEVRTYYDILEVAEAASGAEIKSAYRRLAREYHTDGLPMERTKLRAEADERLKEINEAHDVLKSPQLRATYDAQLRAERGGVRSPPHVSPSAHATDAPVRPTSASGAPPWSPSNGTPRSGGQPRGAASSRGSNKLLPLGLLCLGLLVTLGIENQRRGWIRIGNEQTDAMRTSLSNGDSVGSAAYGASAGTSVVGVAPTSAECGRQTTRDAFVVVSPIQDAYVGTAYKQNGAAEESLLGYGGWGDMYIAFLQFNVADLPRPEDVASATVCLFTDALPPNDPGLGIWRLTQPWRASSLTLQKRPSAREIKVLDPLSNGWNAIDVTPLYRLWKEEPAANFGFSLSPSNTNHTNGAFASSRHPDEAHRPRLVLRLRRSTDQSDALPRALSLLDLDHVAPAYRQMVSTWLQSTPAFGRPAQLSDCSVCEGGNLPADWGWENRHPFYAVGDFNRDGLVDLAIVSQHGDLAMFEGPLKVGTGARFVGNIVCGRATEFGQCTVENRSSYIYYSSERNQFICGGYATETTCSMRSTGHEFVFYGGMDEWETVNIVAPTGRWSDRINLNERPIYCEEFAGDVLVQGDNEGTTIDSRGDWSPLFVHDYLKTIRFQAKGGKDVHGVCRIQKGRVVTP